MHPILVKIGPFAVYSYGLMVAIGFGVAVYLASQRAVALFGIKKDSVIDLSLYILIGGLAGARLVYVLLNVDYYKTHPLEIFYISRGGLVYYGALAFGILVSIIYVLKNKLSFWDVADLLAPYIALAQAIGRIGCFFNGCCYGRFSKENFPLKVYFPQEAMPRHPTQIYSSIVLLLLFLILEPIQKRRHFAGEVFLIYCLLYSLQRFFIEFLRGDNPAVFLSLTASQILSLVVFIASISAYAVFFKRWKNIYLS